MLPIHALFPIVLAATAFEPTVTHQFQSPQGAVQLATGTLSKPLEGPLAPAARQFALDHARALKLPPTSTLSEAEAFGTRFGATFRMRQQVDGIDVDGAVLTVTVDAQRRVIQLASSLVPYARTQTAWTLNADQALKRASDATPFSLRTKQNVPYGGVKKMFFALGDEVRAGYLTWVPTIDLTKNWYLGIDAANGEVLFRQDRAYHAADDAQAYLNSPGEPGVGVTQTQPVTLSHFGPEHATTHTLFGDQLVSWNCCVNEGCATGAGATPKRAQGTLDFFGTPVPYDIAVCDRVQRASNDPGVHASGDFVYAPVDPPAISKYASQDEPADTDEFSEVHAFFHVNNVYDFVRGLSSTAAPLFPDETLPPFQTRDEKAGKRMAVWSNVLIPDYGFTGGGVQGDHLVRTDNAAYMAKENFDQLLVPELSFDTDALFIFQGQTADFGYDAPVYWHEFGHGVIYATAAFNSFTLDARSGNNEGAALHEGIADYFAAAFGRDPVIGAYVGPRLAAVQPGTENGLRDLANTLACPDVLWGEAHQDSQHFSGALWQARTELFQGQDLGDTFDAAFYAALVSMTPKTDFEQAAEIVLNHVQIAFPDVVDAAAKMEMIFNARGVLGCSKVVDVTGATEARRYYGIGGTQQAGVQNGNIVPGPYQMMIHVPEGASSLTVSAQGGGGGPFGGQPQVRLLVKRGEPVTFTKSGTKLTNDADDVVSLSASGQSLTATATVDVGCGEDLYFTLGSAGQGGDTLQNLTFSFEPAATCGVDAGTDAGMETADGGDGLPHGGEFPAIPGGEKGAELGANAGCGCTTVDPSLAIFGLLGLGALARRRRRG